MKLNQEVLRNMSYNEIKDIILREKNRLLPYTDNFENSLSITNELKSRYKKRYSLPPFFNIHKIKSQFNNWLEKQLDKIDNFLNIKK